jgi:hypothetical protein
LPTSRSSCWMTTVALRLAAIFLKRSMDDTAAVLLGRQQVRLFLDRPAFKSDAGARWILHLL